MDVKEVLCMKTGGDNSFARNSTFTAKVIATTKPVLEKAIQSLFNEDIFPCTKTLNVADLGCSSGPNPLSVMSTVIETVEKKCGELKCSVPEIQFYLNDLPSNDFNTLFKSLSSFCEGYKGVSCFAMGAPGSFYGRLFPQTTMHLVHSSYSVHWLSKVPRLISEDGLPLNKGKIYISKSSPPAVSKEYLAQFQEDFTLFLKSRSQEMVPNGRMVLVFHGRPSADPSSKEACYPWEILAEAIANLVSQGVIDEGKLDSFNVPYYMASKEEVQDIMEKEETFTTEAIETFTLVGGDKEIWKNGEMVAKNIRAFTETVISHHFGEENMDKLYENFTHILIQDLAKAKTKSTTIVLVLRRNVS